MRIGNLLMIKHARFAQSDITKVVRGAQVAGYRVTKISIEPDGRIVADLSNDTSHAVEANEWDVVLTSPASLPRKPKRAR